MEKEPELKEQMERYHFELKPLPKKTGREMDDKVLELDFEIKNKK